jgi:phosphatidylinositol glycan class B
MESKPAAEGLRARRKADPNTVPNVVPLGTTAAADEKKARQVHAQVAAAQVRDVLSLLLLFRFINSLCLRTFFQPDEYFQALEPAWRMAFGSESGAWLTWVYDFFYSLFSFPSEHACA